MEDPNTFSPQTSASIKSRMATGYDNIVTIYNQASTSSADVRLSFLSKLLAKLPKPNSNAPNPTKILELGAGAGLPTAKAMLDHDPNIHVIANDISTKQLELLRENLQGYLHRVDVQETDMLSLASTISNGSLAAVVGMYSVIHLPRGEQTQLVELIAKWLKPGGLLLVNFAVEAFEESVDENWLGKGGWMHWSSWGMEGSLRVVEGAGFRVLEREVVQTEGDAAFVWVLAEKEA